MATVELKINVPLDNILLIGKMVIDSLTDDVAIIGDKFTAINPDFLKTLNTKHANVNSLLYPAQLIGKHVKLTQDLYDQLDLLPGALLLTEGHIADAKKALSTFPRYFGISQIREARRRKDYAGLVTGLDKLIQFITDSAYQPLLELQGLKAADINKYKSIYASVTTLFQSRVDNEKQQAALVDNNYTVINDYWADIKNVCDKGKRVFKTSNPTKLADYTMAKLKAKLNRNLELNNIHGLVTLDGKPVNKAQIELLPLEAGPRRTDKSKNGGIYGIGGVVPGKYALTVIADGCKTHNEEVTIKQGQKLELNIQLQPE